MKNKSDYIENLCKTYKINEKKYVLSSTYLPPYNLKKEYTINEIKDVGLGLPYASEIFRSDDLEKCLLEIKRLQTNKD